MYNSFEIIFFFSLVTNCEMLFRGPVGSHHDGNTDETSRQNWKILSHPRQKNYHIKKCQIH